MDIQHTDDGFKGKFFITQNDKELAEMTYVWVGTKKIIIDHTEVDDALRGQGAGRQLLAQAVEFARTKQIKIIPLCPFAKSVFDKVKEYSDVL
jgi:predicted GNAT family acetyltransferase